MVDKECRYYKYVDARWYSFFFIFQDNCPFFRSFDETDSDGDGVGETFDNCPPVTDADQTDTDGDRNNNNNNNNNKNNTLFQEGNTVSKYTNLP